MANRPDYSPDVPLTTKELAEVRLRYAQLSRPGCVSLYGGAGKVPVGCQGPGTAQRAYSGARTGVESIAEASLNDYRYAIFRRATPEIRWRSGA
jgi:hypothetical protein